MDRTGQLLDLLRGRERVTTSEIARQLDVTERTVRRDLTRLAERDVELDVRAGPAGGVRLVRDGSLPALRFTDDEALVLALALGAATADPRLAAPARAALLRLRRVLTDKYGQQLAALVDVVSSEPVDLLGQDEVPARQLFGLCLATARRRRVEISYVAPDGRTTRRPLDPYAVLPMAGHWYVTGYCGLRRDVRTFRVDRIRTLRETDFSVVVPEDFDAEAVVAGAIRRSGRTDFTCTFVLGTDLLAARDLAPAYRMDLRETDGGVVGTVLADRDRLPQIALALLELQVLRRVPVSDVRPAELRTALAELASIAGGQAASGPA